jgi:hypothetical protein
MAAWAAGCSSSNTPTADAGTDTGSTMNDVNLSTTDTGGGRDVMLLGDRFNPPEDGGGAMIPGATVTYTEQRAACSNRVATRRALFGDFHVHTSLSFDAYTAENRNPPAAAYRFAKGETILLPPLNAQGQGTRPVRLTAPLDFAAVTDHSEFLGEVSICTTPGATGYDSATCRAYRLNNQLSFAEFAALLAAPNPSHYPFCGENNANCGAAAGRVWQDTRMAAEAAYDRTAQCAFTSFVAYEWTGTTGGANLHRNVIFRNANVPDQPISYIDQPTASGLWNALRQRCNTQTQGCDVLAIPHNSNYSSGRMFAVEYPMGSTMDQQRQLAQLRQEMEPLVEVAQHKGASECHRAFSMTDEACNFENSRPAAQLCNGDGSGTGTNCVARLDYVRNALGAGMQEEARVGVNPYRFGFIASNDTHNSTPGNSVEQGWPGHAGVTDDDAVDQLNDTNIVFSPAGLVGVWAVENSRDAIFEAIRRRETFGTSGPRIQVRFFGGWEFTPAACGNSNFLPLAYAAGVPMGGTLPARPVPRPGLNPSFVVSATADATPLQRIEVVKVWVNAQGQAQERVVVAAGSANNGASVNTTTCMTTPGAGQMTLCGVWTDDQYNPLERAAYYARVIENPTCRWSTYVCNGLPAANRPAACSDPNVPRQLQERAWSSPIFHSPSR